jgi:hypothetical protein
MATSLNSTDISFLKVGRKYPIIHAERIDTGFGPTVSMTITDSLFNTVKIFLPKLYSSVISDEDILVDIINSQTLSLHLVYKGTCVLTNAYILNVEKFLFFNTVVPCHRI